MERDKYMFDTILIVPWITHVMFVNLKVILWVKKVAVCRKDIKISITLTWPHLGTDEYLEKQKEKSSKVNLNNQEIIALMLSYYLNNCWLYSISNDSFKLLYFIPFLKKCYFPELKKLRFKLKKTSNVWFMAQLKQDQKTMCLFIYYHTYFFWNKVTCRSTGKGVTSPLYNINIITYLNNSLTYSINQRNVKARTTMSRGMHDDTFFFFFNKLVNADADSWVSPLHRSNPKLLCSPLLWIHPTSFDLCLHWVTFLSKGHCCKQWGNRTLFFLFVSGPSPSFTHLLEGLSVARITATDCSVNSTGCNIDVALTQSFTIPWEMKQNT